MRDFPVGGMPACVAVLVPWHRTRLKTYLQSQLRELDSHESAAPADPMRTPQDLVTLGSGPRTETRS